MISLNYSAGFKGGTFSRDITDLSETGFLYLLSPFSFFIEHRQPGEKKINTKTINFFLWLLTKKDEGKAWMNCYL